MPHREVRWRSAILLLVAGLSALYSLAGYVMAGDLQGPGYRTAAIIYLALLALSIAAFIGVTVWRRRSRDSSRPVI